MRWSNPMPMRMGGHGHEQVEDLEATSRANNGSLMSGGVDTEIGLYHRVVALMIAQGFRAARSRALQSDPLRLSEDARPVAMPDGTVETVSPLERWERILRLRPSLGSTVTQRRASVAARRGLTGEATRAALSALITSLFAPWVVDFQDILVDELTAGDARWPGATGTGGYPGTADTANWWSFVYFYKFAVDWPGGDLAFAQRRMAEAYAILDDVLPAHADYLGYYV